MLKKVCFLFLTYLIVGCNQQQQNSNDTLPKTDMGKVTSHDKIAEVSNSIQKEIKDWKSYKELNEFIKEFKKTSATEALNNALELKRLTKQLKDSSKIDIMQIPAFKARINVFENEVLRLADMSYISSISANEVNNQVAKTLQLYGSINTKINTIYLKKRFDNEINLDSIFKE